MDMVIELKRPEGSGGSNFEVSFDKIRGIRPTVDQLGVEIEPNGDKVSLVHDIIRNTKIRSWEQTLLYIDENSPKSAAEIARATKQKEPTMRDHVQKLKREGFLEEDKRTPTLTGEGGMKVAAIKDVQRLRPRRDPSPTRTIPQDANALAKNSEITRREKPVTTHRGSAIRNAVLNNDGRNDGLLLRGSIVESIEINRVAMPHGLKPLHREGLQLIEKNDGPSIPPSKPRNDGSMAPLRGLDHHRSKIL